MTEDEIVGWHHRLDGRVLATLGDDEGQGSLSYCSPRGHKELDTTQHMNNSKGIFRYRSKSYRDNSEAPTNQFL